MKILLHSSFNRGSVHDIWAEYCDAFAKAKQQVSGFNWADSNALKQSTGLRISHSQLLQHEHQFDALVWVGAEAIPDWYLQSCYGKKRVLISVDSPQDVYTYLNQIHLWDLICVNEIKVAQHFQSLGYNHIIYLPMCYSKECDETQYAEKYASDVCWIGAAYDSRIKYLETIAQHCQENNLKFRCIGPLDWVPQNSKLRDVAVDGYVSYSQTLKMYKAAKVVINLNRDENWDSTGQGLNPNPLRVIAASMNPRSHDLARLQCWTFTEGNRTEFSTIYDSPTFNNITELKGLLRLPNFGKVNELIDHDFIATDRSNYFANAQIIINYLTTL